MILKLNCGTYRAVGHLGLNVQNHYIFSLNRNTLSPTEFVLIGGDLDEKTKAIGQIVTVEFYSPRPSSGTSGENIVFLQKISPAKLTELTHAPMLLAVEKCGLDEKFRH